MSLVDYSWLGCRLVITSWWSLACDLVLLALCGLVVWNERRRKSPPSLSLPAAVALLVATCVLLN